MAIVRTAASFSHKAIQASVTAGTPLLLLLGTLLFSTATPSVQAKPTQPDMEDRQITNAVRIKMERKHISGLRVNDTISERCLDAFLKSLDPWKLYFLQSDIDEFNQQRHRLDDFIQKSDVTFAYDVFSRFTARLEERTKMALAEVDAPHDYTVDEEITVERDDTVYPRSAEEATERWRKRVKYDLLVQVADDKTLEEAREKIRKRYTLLRRRWLDTTDDELLELFLTSMTTAFDPHSSYMAPSTLQDFMIQMNLELKGVGAALRSEDGYTTVQEIITGGPADREGSLQEGDIIVSVAQGTDGQMVDIVDMRLRDVVDKIRGERGTIVRLEVKPASNPKELKVYTITRDLVELNDQAARGETIKWGKKPSGEPFKVGVIALPSFYMHMENAKNGVRNFRSTTRDVQRLLIGFREEGVDAVVVDLRFNGGGSLQESVNMTGLFIDQGPVVQVKGPTGRAEPYFDPQPGMVWEGPLAVLTNKFSASASEIFAGAIQDYRRGIVIGDESTHGKGTVQELKNLAQELFGRGSTRNYGALKLTIQQFYRPDGDSTQNRGVLADVVIPSLTEHIKGISESDLDFALAFSKVRPLRHDRFTMLDENIKGRLQQSSQTRINQSEEFKKELKRIDRYEEQQSKKTVTLNKAKYLAEREELDSNKETEDTLEKATKSDRPVFDMEDHYNKEALSIVIDYLRLLGENKLAVTR